MKAKLAQLGFRARAFPGLLLVTPNICPYLIVDDKPISCFSVVNYALNRPAHELVGCVDRSDFP